MRCQNHIWFHKGSYTHTACPSWKTTPDRMKSSCRVKVEILDNDQLVMLAVNTGSGCHHRSHNNEIILTDSKVNKSMSTCESRLRTFLIPEQVLLIRFATQVRGDGAWSCIWINVGNEPAHVAVLPFNLPCKPQIAVSSANVMNAAHRSLPDDEPHPK